MKSFLFIIIFFFVFFRIPIFFTSVYYSLIFGFLGLLLLLLNNSLRNFLLKTIGSQISIIFIFFILLTLAIDFSTGSIINNFKNTFFLRTLTILIMSVIPALLIVWFYIKNNEKKFYNLVFYAFLIQLVFWLYTFLAPSGKDYVYALMNMSQNTNILSEHNYYARGFGYTVEINYTSPFVMVLTALTIFGFHYLTFITIVTQTFNSNNVVIALLLGISARLSQKSLVNFIGISFLILILFISFAFVSLNNFIDYLPIRLQQEFASGGTRTLNTLLQDHMIFINSNFLEYIFGTGEYLFQGGNELSTDIGWIILINYGGILFSLIVFLFFFLLSFRAFKKNSISFIWFLSGIWLNFKGLVFSPNAYVFILFLFLFFKGFMEYSKKRSMIQINT